MIIRYTNLHKYFERVDIQKNKIWITNIHKTEQQENMIIVKFLVVLYIRTTLLYT